ncbi:hypothetical protein KFK09_014048 [Dendrobium nobile]|uniref:Kinesin motor domain-containing protein n=1 Tax=Dendrobium nobile TaxID=94219 RepID=A0A8T3B8W7_DENNO|nr:hypothetical protein KFK09_014048 [Dendrobium nobile]
MLFIWRSSICHDCDARMFDLLRWDIHPIKVNCFLNLRTLWIWSISQPHGLVVPDASMFIVKSTSDVLELMQFGQTNRAVGSTALNERSSQSHSILTVHVRGVDLKTGSTSRGCLYLIDMAGSERVDRFKATGDRLKEAQHINKSLSALDDVIFTLSQKSAHVPYRNSKLTQVLQSSLVGVASSIELDEFGCTDRLSFSIQARLNFHQGGEFKGPLSLYKAVQFSLLTSKYRAE